jgi:hypothetical protein
LDDLTICDVNALFFSRDDWSSRVLDNCSCPLSAVIQTYRFLEIISITIMTGVKEDFVIPFTGALQASLAVLLTIFYGVIAAQFDLLTEKSAKDISKACVRLFLPALLIVNVGQQLSIESVSTRSGT